MTMPLNWPLAHNSNSNPHSLEEVLEPLDFRAIRSVRLEPIHQSLQRI